MAKLQFFPLGLLVLGSMDEPLKKHGDKMKRKRSGNGDKKAAQHQTGGAGEPETIPLEPEEQGGARSRC